MAEALKRTDARPEERYQASQSTWDKIADSKEFKDLMATKRIFMRTSEFSAPAAASGVKKTCFNRKAGASLHQILTLIL